MLKLLFLNVYIGLENSKCCNSNFDLNFSWGWYMCRLSSVNGACIRLLTLLFLFIWIHRSQQWSHKSKLSNSVCTSPSPGHGARWRKVQWIQRDKQKDTAQKTIILTYALFIFNDIKYWVLTPALKIWAS